VKDAAVHQQQVWTASIPAGIRSKDFQWPFQTVVRTKNSFHGQSNQDSLYTIKNGKN